MNPIFLDLTPGDYEDGVAELLALKFEGEAVVERDVRLPSRSGGRDRQIDILIRMPNAAVGEVPMVVDCKRYGRKVNKKDVEAFIGLVNDVGAPMGLLISTEGFTSGALKRVGIERGIHLDVVRIEDLPYWEPALINCEVCAEALGPEGFPGMAYVDQEAEIETQEGEWVTTTLGYCERCAALYLRCPTCSELIVVTEWIENEWTECEGGCRTEWYLRRAAHKDDLLAPVHDRVTLRLPS